MFSEILIGLLLAVVAGITIIAYKDPSRYAQLCKYLIGLLIVGFIACMAWNRGVEYSVNAVVDKLVLSGQLVSAAHEVQESLQIPILWLYAVFVVAEIYLIALTFIPSRPALQEE